MNEAHAARIAAWLTDPRVRAHDAPTVDALTAALVDPSRADALLSVSPHGMTACFSPRPYRGPRRRILELDPGGALVAALRWDDAGSLASAAVRTAADEWIGVEPRAASHPLWGVSDRLWRLGAPPDWAGRELLTVFEALDWASIDHIPALAEPARLPRGAGTAVLNLIAALGSDQGRARLRYRGPYATEQLFAALLESFHPVEAEGDPLQTFFEGRLWWRPAPHERHFPGSNACLQFRGRIEKVVWRGRIYYRPDWPPVVRRTAYAVRDAGSDVCCSLVALGMVVEDHLTLDSSGRVLEITPPACDPRPACPLDPRIPGGLCAIVRADSAPALGPSIEAVMAPLTLQWTGLAGDLVEIADDRVCFGWRLADAGAARIRAAPSAAARFGRSLELLAEMAHLMGDTVRSRAQAVLASSPAEVQDAAFSVLAPGQRADTDAMQHQAEAAARIATATQALTESLQAALG
jgi:hypothetical protein